MDVGNWQADGRLVSVNRQTDFDRIVFGLSLIRGDKRGIAESIDSLYLN